MIKHLLKQSAYLIAPKWAARMEKRYRLSTQVKLLRAKCERLSSIDEVFDEAYRSRVVTVNQKKVEILELLRLLRDLRPKYLCEIGSEGGGTLFLFCNAAAPRARILSIDINFTDEQRWAFRHFGHRGQKVTCLEADSHSKDTLTAVKRWLNGQKLDFLFIDGDHSLSGVSMDYQMFAPHVRKGGIIAFHDIVQDFRTRFGIMTPSDVGEVPQFWQDLKNRNLHMTQEIIDNPDQDGYGIGVVMCGGTKPYFP